MYCIFSNGLRQNSGRSLVPYRLLLFERWNLRLLCCHWRALLQVCQGYIFIFFAIPENMMGSFYLFLVPTLFSEMKIFFRCATGYLGKRCEQKDPYSGKSAVRNSHWRSSICLLGITHYPCWNRTWYLKNSASFIPSDTQSLKEAAYNLGQFFLKEMPLFLAWNLISFLL